MKMLSVKSQTVALSGLGVVLISGGFYFQGFGEFEKVTNVIVDGNFSAQMISGFSTVSGFSVNAFGTIVSNNAVRVQVEKVAMSGGATSIVAGSGETFGSSGVTINVLAFGE